jgi:hypothetical protein
MHLRVGNVGSEYDYWLLEGNECSAAGGFPSNPILPGSAPNNDDNIFLNSVCDFFHNPFSVVEFNKLMLTHRFYFYKFFISFKLHTVNCKLQSETIISYDSNVRNLPWSQVRLQSLTKYPCTVNQIQPCEVVF